MNKVYYTIHFEDEGTGENFDSFVFLNEEEAYQHWAWEYPGYGRRWLKKLSKDEAINFLLDEIRSIIERLNLNSTLEAEIKEYIRDKEPGWQLLYDVYAPCR